jgi:hypothetical protein
VPTNVSGDLLHATTDPVKGFLYHHVPSCRLQTVPRPQMLQVSLKNLEQHRDCSILWSSKGPVSVCRFFRTRSLGARLASCEDARQLPICNGSYQKRNGSATCVRGGVWGTPRAIRLPFPCDMILGKFTSQSRIPVTLSRVFTASCTLGAGGARPSHRRSRLR